jgi:hypothetical protein
MQKIYFRQTDNQQKRRNIIKKKAVALVGVFPTPSFWL